MKKKSALLIAVLIALSCFSGCSGKAENSSTSSSNSQTITSQESSQLNSVQENTSSVIETTQQESPDKASDTASSLTSTASSSVSSGTASSDISEKTSSEQSTEISKNSVGEDQNNVQQSLQTQVSSESSAQPSQVSQTSHVSRTSQVSQTSQNSEVRQSSQSEPSPQPQPHQETSNPVQPASKTDIGGMALYDQLFRIENKVSINITMSKSELDKLQNDYMTYTAKDENKKSEIYRMATVTFTVGSESYTVDEVGIRLKGNQSLEPPFAKNGSPNICSYKLSFDETFDDKDEYGSSAKVWTDKTARDARKKRKFASMNELDVKWNICYDNTNIREVYATKLFESANVLVQKIGLSQMTVNGNNYGLVKIYEPIDKTFLEKRLPESAIGGDLYKCMWSEYSSSGSRTGSWRGANYQTNNSYGIQQNSKGIKYNFNLKTNKKSSDHSSLKNFLSVINKANLTKDELEKVLDVDCYAAFMAASYFAGDPDDIRNNFNNHYLYFRKDNGKAIFIVYDNDRTLGITYGLNRNCAERNPYSNYAATAGDQKNPLIKKTICHDALPSLTYIRDKYAAQLKKLAASEMLTSDADFNRMYNTAKSNYESIITPYTRFANQEETFRFSLDGNKNGGDRANMSFEQFRSQIMNTYKNSKP